MMSQIGPYIEDHDWQDSVSDLKSGLPQQFAESWQEPIFDARHVPMTNRDGAPLKGGFIAGMLIRLIIKTILSIAQI